MYTIWAGVQVFIVLMTTLVMYRGAQWRAASEAKVAPRQAEKDIEVINADLEAETSASNDKKTPESS